MREYQAAPPCNAGLQARTLRRYNESMAELEKVDLVGVGLNATDTLIRIDTYPERGSKQKYSQGDVLLGGQVATAVVACQSWGLSTRYVGKLGSDEAARLHEAAFQQAGVEARLIQVPGGVSPQSLILVDAGGERTVLNRRDESMTLLPGELNREWIVNARVLHVDGHDTVAATLAASWAREAGVITVADLDDPYPGVDDLAANIDYLIVNHDFPGRLTGDSNLELALQRMMECYGSRLTAATLGEQGVLAWDGSRMIRCAGYRVPVADTTGAGDMFRAGFIYGLLQDWPLERQLEFSCAAAAMNCTAHGARGGIRPVAEIEELMATAPRYANV